MNSKKRLAFLLEKYNSQNCSPDELRELELWYQSLNSDMELSELIDSEKFANEMLEAFHADREIIQAKNHSTERRNAAYRVILQAAAVVAIISGIVLFGRYSFKEKTSNLQPIRAAVNTEQNRFITLLDGSKVVLKANSTLKYTNSFKGKTREVVLIGEAYFDIHHDADRPFIIHTGKLSVKVLGTAFNINASPSLKNIVVTVTRGKVQVADESKILAVLTPNKQISYDKNTTLITKEEVKAEEKIRWVRQDMEFDAETFGNIADQLSYRYNVKINFENPTLKNCPITATFKGAESLDEVLNVLCMTRKSKYETRNKEIFINGQGCDN